VGEEAASNERDGPPAASRCSARYERLATGTARAVGSVSTAAIHFRVGSALVVRVWAFAAGGNVRVGPEISRENATRRHPHPVACVRPWAATRSRTVPTNAGVPRQAPLRGRVAYARPRVPAAQQSPIPLLAALPRSLSALLPSIPNSPRHAAPHPGRLHLARLPLRPRCEARRGARFVWRGPAPRPRAPASRWSPCRRARRSLRRRWWRRRTSRTPCRSF
jgi:hypothetical protein